MLPTRKRLKPCRRAPLTASLECRQEITHEWLTTVELVVDQVWRRLVGPFQTLHRDVAERPGVPASGVIDKGG